MVVAEILLAPRQRLIPAAQVCELRLRAAQALGQDPLHPLLPCGTRTTAKPSFS